MQYLLTENEYLSIKNHARDERDALRKVLQDLCTKVADHMPVKFWGNTEPKIWGCIRHSKENMGYCDECPAKDPCPYESKRFSK